MRTRALASADAPIVRLFVLNSEWVQGIEDRLYSKGYHRLSSGVRLMPTQQELLFTDLNALTDEQIEAGLAAGVWRENRPFVEQYLDQIRLTRSDAAVAAQGLEAIRGVVNNARAAEFRATIALIVAAGAMLAAMAAAFVAFMALSGMTISW
jgi:hypothetical protein